MSKWCGSSAGYADGCRCDACREAHRVVQADYRKRKANKAAVPGAIYSRHELEAFKPPPPMPDELAQNAACKGMNPDRFFPARGEPMGVAAAVAVCERCPVRDLCLDYALEANERAGVWGGTTGKERREMRSAWLKTKGLRDGSSPQSTALPDADPSPAAVPAPPPGSSTARWPRLGGHHFHGDRIA